MEYYWTGLKAVPGVGNVCFRRLLERFDTPQGALEAPAAELASVKGVTPAVIAAISSGEWRRFAEEECLKLETSGATLVTFLSPSYPKALFEITDPPPFLYLKGTLEITGPVVAVVGSRRATAAGLAVTRKLAEELAASGVCIVSGMARGVDSAAHKGALQAGGSSIGVLGCGVDVIYPPENRALFEQMADKGGVISEFPLGTLPLAENFPRRNRIVSGLANGVLIIEAAEKSGSLITAQYALEQGRDVFAVPGSILSVNSRGCNRLIKQGAKLVDCVDDILEELPGGRASADPLPLFKPVPHRFALTPKEALVFELLAKSPLHIDEIATRSELTPGEVSSILLHLELKGAVSALPGTHYALTI